MVENLDASKCGGWRVFIAPTTKMVVGKGCCRMAHWTVRCTTGHCPMRQPRHPTVRVRPLELGVETSRAEPRLGSARPSGELGKAARLVPGSRAGSPS
jgi:hypothetical protein